MVLALSLGPAGTLAAAEEPPEAGTCRAPESLFEARSSHTATLLRDGRVLVVGGAQGFLRDPFASAEVWDPATESFGPAGSLAQARADHSATALPDGRVLVVGGEGKTAGGMGLGDPLASAEICLPVSAPEAGLGFTRIIRVPHSVTPRSSPRKRRRSHYRRV